VKARRSTLRPDAGSTAGSPQCAQQPPDVSPGCEDDAVLLTVQIADWELEESGRILSVGDRHQFWLTFEEAERRLPATDVVNLIHGVAVPLPTWPGAGSGRHPIRIDVDGGALYWDAPEPVSGRVEVAGTISTNIVDAPEGFPETSCVLRRVRMVWDDLVVGPEGVWRSTGEGPRYEEVTSTYLPVPERTAFDPEVEAELGRRARAAYDRELAEGRRSPGESFTSGLKVPPSSWKVPAGTTETRWTGVLMDLETVDADRE